MKKYTCVQAIAFVGGTIPFYGHDKTIESM